MLASSSSSGEPGEVRFRGQVTSESLPITMIAPAEGRPAPDTPSPGRTKAIDRRGSYTKTAPRISTSRGPTSPRLAHRVQEIAHRVLAAEALLDRQLEIGLVAEPRGKIDDRVALSLRTIHQSRQP
jgi:hypothetical protein